MPKTVFVVSGMTKVYQMGEVRVDALRGIDLSLATGELVVPRGLSAVSGAIGRGGGVGLPGEGGSRAGHAEGQLPQCRRRHVVPAVVPAVEAWAGTMSLAPGKASSLGHRRRVGDCTTQGSFPKPSTLLHGQGAKFQAEAGALATWLAAR
jgi:hypothetical protein